MNPGPATTTISLFGHFGYQQGERTLTQFSYDKVKALLVYLLMQETPVSRAALAEMLWPDQGVKSGRTNLRHALHCLRHSLGDLAEASLSVTRQTIAFDLPASVVWDLRAADDLLQQTPSVATLERLLEYYRGDLLAELHLGQCVAFQQWLVRTRGEWRQRLIEYAERVLEAASALPEALLRTLIHRIPDYGPFHERLVRQLAEHGQFAAAREQFNAFLQHLALSGQQPEPGFLQLARFWSEVPAQGVASADWLSQAGSPAAQAAQPGALGYVAQDIDYRQITVMAIALRPVDAGNDLGRALACLKAQGRLFQWLETQCRHLGGFWQTAVGSGIGLACFGTHGPTHQLAELVALFEHCRQGLARELDSVWEGDDSPPRFMLTAGLDSGRVIWLPERQSIDPFGDVTQVALAMMVAAQSRELVISLNASQHLPPAFDLQSRLTPRLISSDGRVQRRGLVLGVESSRREALPPSLMGREAELRQLRDALARVSLGLRQSLLVLGDTGIGKSALMIHFREYLQHEDVAVFWRPTTRLSSQTSYGLIQSLLGWYLEREPDGEALGQLIDRTAVLQKIGSERRRLLIDVLGREPLAREDADEAVELVTQLVQALILEMAFRRPLVIIVDDLQWLDEPSLKVLLNLQARLPIHTASLLIASHQNREVPPIRLNWDQQVILGRLDGRQSADMLEYLARRHRLKLGPRLRDQLIQRCEGVPLYLQEICRRLEIDRREGRRLNVDSLPSGLLGLLASRIDQLQGDRQVAHMAAIFGRQFEAGMLRDCLEVGDDALKAALEQMRRLEIIEPCETCPYDFQFTHPLLQEAAYLSCPQDVRIALHQRVVEVIESRYPAWISRHPGDFAEHLRRSGDPARAARYFEMAARSGLKVSANRTALRLAESGLACLNQVSAGGAERQISLLTVKGQACYALEGHGSRAAHESFLQAQELWQGADLDDEAADDQAFLVTWGLWVGASQRHANRDAELLAMQLRELAQRIDDPRYQRLALYARAHGEYWSGRISLAYEHLDQIDPLNQPMVLEWLPYSDHPQVAAACYQSWALCLRGDYLRAEQQMETAIRLAESVRHPGSLALALIFAASLYRQLGHIHLATERGRRAHEMTRTEDLQRWHWEADCVLGWSQSLAGEACGLKRIEACIAQLSELTGREPHQRPLLWYGDACLALNDVALAVTYLEPCLDQARTRRSLMMPQLALQMARARHRMGDDMQTVAALIEEARIWAVEAGSAHMELKSLEMWLSLVDSGDKEKQQALRYRLGEVALSDAPVLTRWRTLLDNVSAPTRAPDYQL